MASVNKVIILGNLGADPEIRETKTGDKVGNFRMATSYKDDTTWHTVVVFGKMAELCGEYLSKGSQAYVEGRIQERTWDDADGNKRYKTEIVAERVQFLGGKKDNNESAFGF